MRIAIETGGYWTEAVLSFQAVEAVREALAKAEGVLSARIRVEARRPYSGRLHRISIRVRFADGTETYFEESEGHWQDLLARMKTRLKRLGEVKASLAPALPV